MAATMTSCSVLRPMRVRSGHGKPWWLSCLASPQVRAQPSRPEVPGPAEHALVAL